MRVSLVVAMTKNRVIGINRHLPWRRLKSDITRFKTLTTGHSVIMGRRTYDSLPDDYRPLPNRTNIVLSRNWEVGDDLSPLSGCEYLRANSLGHALTLAAEKPGADEIFVIGGEAVYEAFLPIADRIYLTEVDAKMANDVVAVFPPIQAAEWIITEEGSFARDNGHDYSGRFLRYDRKHRYPIVEPRNARNGAYRRQLEAILASGQCPFCPGGTTFHEQPVVRVSKFWWLTENAHPLANTAGHLLLIPKRHLERREDLLTEEILDLWDMERWINQSYSLTGSILYGRSGDPFLTGATVAHIHFQVIVPSGTVHLYVGPPPCGP